MINRVWRDDLLGTSERADRREEQPAWGGRARTKVDSSVGYRPAITLPPDVATLRRLASGAAARASGENFPVALRVVPAVPRAMLRRVYAYARFVDEVGDSAPGDRARLLDVVELDVRAASSGTARIPVVRDLGADLAAGRLGLEPLLDLIEANRRDQTVLSYATFADLLEYCRFSAAPVGRLVLQIAGADTPANREASDRTCAALQVLEHCQDVGEDARAGRVYLPADDLRDAGVSRPDLLGGRAGPGLRRVIALQVARAEVMLAEGDALARRLSGWARIAVAGYVAGGRATADALRRAGYDVLGRTVLPRRYRTARRALPLLLPARARTGAGATEAYRHCTDVTNREARNFAWGIRLLPPAKRRALCAVYALARRVDDIGDGDLPPDEKRRRLDAVRGALADPDAYPDDPVLVALADAARRYPVPLEAFADLVRGCEMDVTGQRYGTFEDLVEYCRCVAGSIGRLCLGVFHPALSPAETEQAPRYADALGVALQLTNILRDIREDLGMGRVYLPAVDLRRFGVELRLAPDGTLDPCGGALAQLIRYEVSQAEQWYATGLRLLPLLDRRSAACCAAMAGIYRELLHRIATAPEIVLSGRASLGGMEKARIATRSLAGRGA
jgi:phytoene synthase